MIKKDLNILNSADNILGRACHLKKPDLNKSVFG